MGASSPAIIMMYKVGLMSRPDDTVSVWAKTRCVKEYPYGYRLVDTVITRDQAMAIIKKSGLTLAVSNAYGRIWHDPNNTIKSYLKHQ
jgi:hypothetical protein